MLDYATVIIETTDGYSIDVTTNERDEFVLSFIIPNEIIESDGGMDSHFISMDLATACELLKGVAMAVDRLKDRAVAATMQEAQPIQEFVTSLPNAPFPEESEEMMTAITAPEIPKPQIPVITPHYLLRLWWLAMKGEDIAIKNDLGDFIEYATTTRIAYEMELPWEDNLCA